MGLKYQRAVEGFRFTIGMLVYCGLVLGLALESILFLIFFGVTAATWVPLGFFFALVIPVYIGLLCASYSELQPLRVRMVTAALEGK